MHCSLIIIPLSLKSHVHMLHQKSLLFIISLLLITIVIKTLLYSNALVCHTPCVLLVYYLLVHIILYIYQPPLYIVNAAVV